MSVEFEPVRLGRRGRRVDPIALSAVVVVLGLFVAVLKPWGAEDGGGGAAPGATPAVAASVAAIDLTGPRATASVAIPRVIQARTTSGLTWDAVDGVVHRHEAWGVRAIVVDRSRPDTPIDARSRLVEAWFPVAGMDGGQSPSVQVDPGGRSIVALGVTFPPANTPLDIRIWRATSTGLDWVDIQSVDAVPSEGAYLYVRPASSGVGSLAWGSGRYRVDVLVDGTIRRFEIGIPDRFSNVPDPPRPSLRDQRPPIEPLVTPEAVPMGLFAMVDDTVVPIESTEGPPLDEAAEWRDLDPGTGRPPRSFVGAAYLPRATVLGVALARRSVVMAATLTRLAPEPLAVVATPLDRTPADTPIANVLFRAPGGGAWPPGVYRLTVVWADFEGLHEESWHAELRPGPVRELPPLLAAARSWARYAGTNGVILGTAEPLGTGSTSSPIREIRLRPATAGYPAATGVGCGGTVIEERPRILGFAYPSEHGASVVNARIERPFLRRDDQVLLTANPGVPGLVLAAPARIGSLPGADWVFTVRSGADDLEYALCLDMSTFEP